MTSVVIVGKGISVLNSTQEFMNSFDEIAFCNFPPIKGYEKYIGSRCDWMFANMWDPNPYDPLDFVATGCKSILNTHTKPFPDTDGAVASYGVEYCPNYGTIVSEEFQKWHGFDPSTGLQAFDFFVKNPDYDTIGLVGFDNFKVGQKAYYYSVDEVQPSLKYLYTDGDTPYTSDGIRREATKHGSTELMEKYIEETSKKYDKIIRRP